MFSYQTIGGSKFVRGLTKAGQGIARIVAGGLTAIAGGGKFKNGAVTAAFAHAFNELRYQYDVAMHHYTRNHENDEFLKSVDIYGRDDLTIDEVQSAGDYGMKRATDLETRYHRIGEGNEQNLKFTSKIAHQESLWQQIFSNRYGRHEIIIKPNGDGTYTHVTDSVNMGTMNRGNNPVTHYFRDMVPYEKYGNTPSK